MVRALGWHRGIAFRSTAGLLVVSLVTSPTAFAFGPLPITGGGTPMRSAAPKRSVAVNAPSPAEDVPGRLSVANVTLGGGMPWALDPRVLFDGDSRTQLAVPGVPLEIRMRLAGTKQVDGLSIWGAPGGMLSARAEHKREFSAENSRAGRSKARMARPTAGIGWMPPRRSARTRSCSSGAGRPSAHTWTRSRSRGAGRCRPTCPKRRFRSGGGRLPPGAAAIAATPKEIAVVGNNASTLDWARTASYRA